MKLTYDSSLDRRRDPRGPHAMKKGALSFEEWEDLPSDIKLTRGECNQIYNMLTHNMSNPPFRVLQVIRKLREQI